MNPQASDYVSLDSVDVPTPMTKVEKPPVAAADKYDVHDTRGPEAPTDAVTCNACPYCADVCSLPGCSACALKRQQPAFSGGCSRRGKLQQFTMCQVKRHCTDKDLWLVAHGKVYDVTAFVPLHPGGHFSLVRHAGTDSTVDFDFHSCGAKKLWDDYLIGTVVRCASEPAGSSCTIM